MHKSFIDRLEIEMSLAARFIVAFLSVACISCNAVGGNSNLRPLANEQVGLTPDAADLKKEAAWDAKHGRPILDLAVDKCTTIAVGPKAGIYGPMATHTADCADCDFRIGKVKTGTQTYIIISNDVF